MLSGLLFGFAFVPFPFLTWFFALVPLWLFIYKQNSLKKVLIGSFLCQFIATLVGFNWMIYTFHHFGGMNWFLSFIFLMGFCAIANLYVTLSGVLCFFVTSGLKGSRFSPPVKLLFFPLIFSLLHLLIPTVFPWNMGYPWLWGGLPGAQTAELWGFRFLNTLFYVFNLLVLIFYNHTEKKAFIKLFKNFKPVFKQGRGPVLSQVFKQGVGAVLNQVFKQGRGPVLSQVKGLAFVIFILGFLFLTQVFLKQQGANPLSVLEVAILFSIFLFSFIILSGKTSDKVGKIAFSSLLILFFGLNGLGVYLKQKLAPPDKTAYVVIVQNNIGSLAYSNKSSFYQAKKASLYTSKSLTVKALFKHLKKTEFKKPATKTEHKNLKKQDIDFILWPEGAYPYVIRKKANTVPKMSRFIKTIKIPIITGGISKYKGQFSNSLFVFNRKGELLKPVYDKFKLLIFGEYFPGMHRFPVLRKIFPYFGANLIPGKGPTTQKLEGKTLGLQICYESLFDNLTRSLAKQKAQILVNITNDSWYGTWQEPYQHLAMNFARAIEVRRPLIRATNTGYSSVIYANGQIDKISPIATEWFGLYKVPYYKNPPTTLFMSWGYYINEMFLFFLTLLIIGLTFKPAGEQKKATELLK